jgi:hypothetical protein
MIKILAAIELYAKTAGARNAQRLRAFILLLRYSGMGSRLCPPRPSEHPRYGKALRFLDAIEAGTNGAKIRWRSTRRRGHHRYAGKTLAITD